MKAPSLTRIFDVIEGGGGVVRVAGGAVRNALLKVPVADIDLATDLAPEKVTELCEAAGLKVAPTGIAHGTVTVVSEGRPYEVTTLRHDVETDGRRARVSFTDDWQADAARRDFTMNAMFCDRRGKICDFTNGYDATL
ncbi:MAG: CCA tRNA nucleotidyltransferase, partial [Aestuariivirga sp.]